MGSCEPCRKVQMDLIWRCFGDFRDKLLLEYEKRIYNNLKISYDENVIDLADFIETDLDPPDLLEKILAR